MTRQMGAAGMPHKGPCRATPIWGGHVSTDPRLNLEVTWGVSGTGRNHFFWPCALGQMPNANRFCHQDREGLDTDQLLLPGDRLLECRRALSKIDGHCQKMISPQPNAGPQRSSNTRQRCLLGRAGRRPARQGPLTWPSCFPAPGSPQFPSEKKSRQGPHLGGAVGKQESLAPLGESEGTCRCPFYSPCTEPPGGVTVHLYTSHSAGESLEGRTPPGHHRCPGPYPTLAQAVALRL